MLLRLHNFRHVTGNDSPHGAATQAKLTLVAASFCIFLVQLDFFALNLALPRMASELRTSTTSLQWVISAYMLSLAAFLIPGGRLGDILGRKRILMSGVVIFGLSSLGGALAPNAGTVIAFRVLQGIGSGIIFPLAIAVVTSAFPEKRVKRAIGYAYGIGAVAMALGPPFGGGITELVVWRVVLLVNVPLSIAAIAIVAGGVRESRDPTVPRSIDLPGLALVASGIALVTLAVDLASTWLPVATAGIAVVGLLILAVFVLRERVAKYPLVKLDLFRNRPYVIVTLMGTVANIALVIGVFGSTIYLQQGENRSPFAAGLILLAASVAAGVAGPISGRLGEHLDIPRTMAVSTTIGGIGLFVVSLGGGFGSYLPGLALFGFGYGVGFTMANIGTQTVVARERVGEASGVTLAIVIGVAGIGVAAAGTLIDIGTKNVGLTRAIEDVLRWAAAGSILASGVLLLVDRHRAVDRHRS
ncbi:MFS transporter [Micromonospora sp. WMMA1363]|uniref:MFS transporter n=1 Tax=Micromonospora sp. WMMA1363 TaxID=3053985 RepID=UPI00259CCE17|nr:MFS transporter [Micromonospora sp. WMMA1363]MDM4720661.1 MFS transporter [Micromonospora sp. WMMA1363]